MRVGQSQGTSLAESFYVASLHGSPHLYIIPFQFHLLFYLYSMNYIFHSKFNSWSPYMLLFTVGFAAGLPWGFVDVVWFRIPLKTLTGSQCHSWLGLPVLSPYKIKMVWALFGWDFSVILHLLPLVCAKDVTIVVVCLQPFLLCFRQAFSVVRVLWRWYFLSWVLFVADQIP